MAHEPRELCVPAGLGAAVERATTMRLGATLLCAVLCVVSLATQVTGNSLVQNNLLKEAQRSPNGVIELDETNYDLFLAAPRDFSVTVLYTAMDARFNCAACKMFMPSYEQVARGWQKKKNSKRHVFAVVEASRAMNVMRKVRGRTDAEPVHARPYPV